MPDGLTSWEETRIKREIAMPECEENEDNITLSGKIRYWVARVLVVGWAATAALTIPTVMVLATLNKQPEFAAMLAKVWGFAGILALSGFWLKKMWTKKQIAPHREESDDELGDC